MQLLPPPTQPVALLSLSTDLTPATHTPSARNPALVYLASLAASRRTMRQALDTIASILTSGGCDHVTLPWSALRFQHTQAVRRSYKKTMKRPPPTRCRLLCARLCAWPGIWAI